MSSVTSEQGQPIPEKSALPEPAPSPRAASWAGWLVVGLYVLASFALTWRLWADPAGRAAGHNPGDVDLVAWFMRYSATAVSHGRLPALVTTGLNAPQGINMMWNASMLLAGVVLSPVTLLAGPLASLTILLTVGFAGSAASLFWVLRRWGASVTAAAIGGAVYGFSPALVTASAGHFQLQFAMLPPLIIHELLRILTGRGSAVRAGLWLGLLAAAQVYLGEELLADTAVAAAIIVAVLALSHPRASAQAVRARGGAMAAGLGTAVAAAGVACGYALWVQFRGPLSEHGSPWTVIDFHSYLYGFVTPSGALAFHTASSAAVAARYPEPSPEYLAYLGWPLLAIAVVAAIAFWRDDRVRVAAVTFALLELFSLGDVPVSFFGIRYPAALLPWHWLAGNPVGANVLPDRFSILADGAVAALLAFALDRARGQARSSGLRRVGGYAATLIVVLAVLPLVPLPLPVEAVPPAPAGWQAAFTRLQLPADAHVLVIPDLQYGLRWQAETGVPTSMVGGGDFIVPGPGGKATSYIYERLRTAQYLTTLWQGQPTTRAPSQAQIRNDLASWQVAAIVTATGRDSPLARFLTKQFGPATVDVGDVLAWRLAPPLPSSVKLWAAHDEGRCGSGVRDDRHHRGGRVPRLASLRAASGRRLLSDMRR